MRDGQGFDDMANGLKTGLACMALCSLALPANVQADEAEPSIAAASKVAAAGELHIDITNMRSDKGMVVACLTAAASTFPKCANDPAALRLKVPATASHLVFRGVKPGRYAVALLHDENGNGKADRAITMIPREGFGFSRDAKVRMGPPKFNDAVFVMPPRRQAMTIKMRYML